MENDKEIMAIEKPLTAIEVRKQVNLIQEIMKKVMKEGEHYGKVPGCGDKKVLLKSGGEKLAMTFRLGAEYEELPGSVESDDFVCYKINCKLIYLPNGRTVGNGRGTCNSKEKKYRTRSVFASKVTADEVAIGKPDTRIGKDGRKYDVLIVPQDPWDVQNTLYKMACKRALVAAILTATAASDIFTQDIEDLPEGTMIEDEATTHKPAVAMPQEKKVEIPAPSVAKPLNGNNLISEAQAKRLYAIRRTAGHTEEDVKKYLLENYGINSASEIDRAYYEDICLFFGTPKVKNG